MCLEIGILRQTIVYFGLNSFKNFKFYPKVIAIDFSDFLID